MTKAKARRAAGTDKNGSDDILAAAAEAFMELGFHATSIDSVARRLGATKGRVYHYYKSKADLFFDVHREGMRRNFAAVEPAMRGSGSAADRLAAMLRQLALTMMENLAFGTVVVQGVHTQRLGATTPDQRRTVAELMSIRGDFEALFEQIADEGVQEGTVLVEEVSTAVKAALGAIAWISVWYRPRPGETRRDREVLAEQIVATIMLGMCGGEAATDAVADMADKT